MVSCRDVLSYDSPKIKGIKGNRPLKVGRIRWNPATIALAKFFLTSSRVRTGLSGLPCSRSGRSEKRPSVIHDFASFGRHWNPEDCGLDIGHRRWPCSVCGNLRKGASYRRVFGRSEVVMPMGLMKGGWCLRTPVCRTLSWPRPIFRVTGDGHVRKQVGLWSEYDWLLRGSERRL